MQNSDRQGSVGGLSPTQRNDRFPLDSEPDDVLAWLRLIRDRRWSRAQKHQLLKHLQCPITIYQTSDQALRTITGRFQKSDAGVSQANLDDDLRWLAKPGHVLLTQTNSAYPHLLAQIDDAPIALFAKGDIQYLSEPKVAVVGSRRPTPIGVKVVDRLAAEMASMGLVITSGMALGIDALAHQAALKVGQPTIAVMACGFDRVYPPRNRHLFESVSEHGLLLSEYPLGVAPTKYTFPQRNRIVSGLSLGVLIVEAAERSGTLITARLAAEQNREVMIVPGSSLSPQYQGSHRLLQQGAALVCCLDDILFCLKQPLSSVSKHHHSKTEKTDCQHSSDQSRSLLCHIGYESTSVDAIISASGLTAAEVCAMLLTLELDGAVATTIEGGYLNLC